MTKFRTDLLPHVPGTTWESRARDYLASRLPETLGGSPYKIELAKVVLDPRHHPSSGRKMLIAVPMRHPGQRYVQYEKAYRLSDVEAHNGGMLQVCYIVGRPSHSASDIDVAIVEGLVAAERAEG